MASRHCQPAGVKNTSNYLETKSQCSLDGIYIQLESVYHMIVQECKSKITNKSHFIYRTIHFCRPKMQVMV